ncbi:hypothetical protein [Primorskyibacter sedentarius]|uniref:hypothetical protein n=1 Tax=Primorskyibacter sedentarius TaxID=745311 RepID=UPI001047F52A|nr:hypothetical protein [Primorskyibacter sedentarius]
MYFARSAASLCGSRASCAAPTLNRWSNGWATPLRLDWSQSSALPVDFNWSTQFFLAKVGVMNMNYRLRDFFGQAGGQINRPKTFKRAMYG